MNKQLILISGSLCVGKTAVGTRLFESYDNSAYLDWGLVLVRASLFRHGQSSKSLEIMEISGLFFVWNGSLPCFSPDRSFPPLFSLGSYASRAAVFAREGAVFTENFQIETGFHIDNLLC